MKTRIVAAIAAVLLICLLVEVSPPIFKHRAPAERGNPHRGLTNAGAVRSFRYVREEWMSNARTAAGALRYLLESEPPQTNVDLVASNVTKKPLLKLGADLPARPRPTQSNPVACFDCPAVRQTTGGDSFSGYARVGSITELRPCVGSSPSLFHAMGIGFPDSCPACPIEERAKMLDSLGGFDGVGGSTVLQPSESHHD